MVGRAALVLGSILLTLIVLELGCRLAQGADWLVHWPNLVLQARRATIANGVGRLVHDDRLGFVARPGYASAGENYDQHSFRRSPAPEGLVLAEPPILVVGDSYADGDEVTDSETWPAHLQALMRRHVVNAAMSGYGIDQMVLRAEIVVPQIKPAAIVLSFIADDVRRAEMKRVWGAEKPYFDLRDGTLVLRNTPVPPSPAPADTLSLSHRLFGWSMLVDTVLKHQGWQYEWALDFERVLPESAGKPLACALMRRLAGLGLPILVVAEYDPYLWKDDDYAPVVRQRSKDVLDCAADAGLATLDMFETIDKAVRARGLDAIYRVSHPGPEGTRLAAARIADELRRRHIPPR